jgi:hypothetical protein
MEYHRHRSFEFIRVQGKPCIRRQWAYLGYRRPTIGYIIGLNGKRHPIGIAATTEFLLHEGSKGQMEGEAL